MTVLEFEAFCEREAYGDGMTGPIVVLAPSSCAMLFYP